MLTEITLGQYFPGESLVHKLDARIKIILLIFSMVTIFVCNTAITYTAMTLFVLLIIICARISAGLMIKAIKPLWWILLFTFLIHFAATEGEIIYTFWMWNFTKEGFIQGIFISLRLVLLISLSSILTFTTSPLALTDALESLLRPFKKIGLPAHELAIMMTIALRFVPTLIEETDKIMKAQQSRGSDFSSGNIFKRMNNLIPIMIPLFVSSFRRADDLAMAMEARCYRGGIGRTHLKEPKATMGDYIVVVLGSLILFGIGVLRMVGV